jgi:hypothetical protein
MPITPINFAAIDPINFKDDMFSGLLKMREAQHAGERRGLENEGMRHKNTIEGAEAQYAPDKYKFANQIQEAKARYAAEQEQADVRQKLAHAAYFKNGGFHENPEMKTARERRMLFNGMGEAAKQELYRMGHALGWSPQQAQQKYLEGVDFSEEAQKLGIDLSNGKHLPTNSNITNINDTQGRLHELDYLENATSNDLSLYGATFYGYSPEQIADALNGENKDKVIRYLGAVAVQPEINLTRSAIAGGGNAVRAIEHMQEASLANLKAFGFTITPEIRKGVQEYINTVLKGGGEARLQGMMGGSRNGDQGNKNFADALKNNNPNSANTVKIRFKGVTKSVPANIAERYLKNPEYELVK